MAFRRIRPYTTFALSDDGARTKVTAHEIVLERPVGVDLEINLAPHPSFRGGVSLSTFRGSALIVEPGSSGHAYVFIEEWPVGDHRRKSRRRYTRGTLGHVYLVDAQGEKKATASRRFVIQCSTEQHLLVDLCPKAPWARHVKIESSTGLLAAHLSAANVVQFRAEA